ncbi:hypothetical protein A3F58_02125 [Candidatus Roizmanbacteria bacterium RIFCSPHIGHO2_12_FULL_37_9b]|uniref:Addiction module toxin, HicA family n=1 Tax=Candidatus Roizmanbacteria bacterium RIFCSPHIGHO2_02_FULL_38_11 TaxID=1802039 RepID=A0A1F7H0P5_9BACT|nr:MAG: hypothetical protein A3C25_03890 [Candidatus Roizmanbacteria bacterium RIFCSPHIGHO2_02_FULL_38_11]OGK33355.1 MAG: hypothetical protein A3F58_02125 [Candidatus Roizmanbacteria bacterium RIFCSPHIGHO2_12_FULL_37_9b]
MPKVYSARLILKVLRKAGFIKVSQKGSHIKLKGIREGRILTVIVPNHKTIAKGTFQSILEQSEMTSSEFEQYV